VGKRFIKKKEKNNILYLTTIWPKEEGQTTIWPKEKDQKDKKQSTKHYTEK
jgi:hypothetical protein